MALGNFLKKFLIYAEQEFSPKHIIFAYIYIYIYIYTQTHTHTHTQ